MKKIFLSVFIATALVSCDKNSIQQTTDNIKRADSLFTKANDGIKTLDSISKTINSDDGITKKVIIPEIEKQKKAIDSTIKSGGWKIDSINKEIEKITNKVKTGTDVVKTLDSANDALNKGESPLVVLTKTADKILKQTKSANQNSQQKPQPQNQSEPQTQPQVAPPIVEKNPLVKTGKLEIQVENLSDSKALLKQKIRESNADLITENFSQTEGISKEYFTVKVPISSFDQLVNSASTLGEIKMKNTETEGKDYVSGQMCDVEITLFQNENFADNSIIKTEKNGEKTDTFSDKSSNAFMKGFKVLGDGLLFLLPFWPIFLIGIVIWYFIDRNKKRKAREEFKRQMMLNQQKTQYPTENQTSTENVQAEEKEENDEPDYSKYLPKN